MGRTPLSFAILRRRLLRAGHRPSAFAYFVSRDSLQSIADQFVAHVQARVGPGEQYAVVGHSLGGIVTRLASPKMPPGFCRFAMLAPPNRSPAAARMLRDNGLFQALTKDAGQKLGDDAFYATLPTPDVPTLVFAGTTGMSSPFHKTGDVGDLLLSTEETRLAGATHIEIRAIHSFIMNHLDVARLIVDFLKTPQ